MDSFDLFSAVQPTEGWFAVVGIGNSRVIQKLVQNRDAFNKQVEAFKAKNYDVYFGVAKYNDPSGRTKDNVYALRSFWLDIDVSFEKAQLNELTGIPQGYSTQKTALIALHAFCITTGLPFPIVVNSGRGLHVYWALTQSVKREDWEPVAHRLRDLCVLHNFYVDKAVFDATRILRVPGTLNYKGDPPHPVEMMSIGVPMEFEALRDLLGVREDQLQKTNLIRKLTALGQSMLPDETPRFERILKETAKGQGCQQLKACIEQRATLSEPRWFDALSIAKFCEDKTQAIEVLSSGHKDYDPDEAEIKTHHIAGPHSCQQFELNNPGGCLGCPKRGKITSPIVIGRPLQNRMPPPTPTDEVIDYKLPPQYCMSDAGLWRLGTGAEGGDEEILNYPFEILKRMRDPSQGDVTVVRIRRPSDGIIEVVLPNGLIADPTEFRKRLAAEGVVCHNKQFNLLTQYFIDVVSARQHEDKAETMRLQFGWVDDDSCFVIGDRELSAEEPRYSPPSSVTQSIAEHMKPAGTLEAWREVFNLYGKPGLEPLAFAALTGFGAPLMKFLGQKGLIINLIHPQSGTGKTTALHMCNSIWGAPDRLCSVASDTLNAKIMRLGVMNNLPFTVDEITNTSALEFSTLAYNMSQGRGKDRVKSAANEMRTNLTSWQTMSLCSSNASFYEKLAAAKNAPAGEFMRLLEYKVDHKSLIDPKVAKLMFDHQLMENYGHAGDIYATYLVREGARICDTVMSIQKKIDTELNFSASERIWSAGVAANITGGLIAGQLGLHNWDMQRVYKFASTLLADLRRDVKQPAFNAERIIGAYLNARISNALVIESKAAAWPVSEPKGPLLVRYEPDTKHLFIAVSEFKEHCAEQSISYKTVVEDLTYNGALLAVGIKNMSRGMKLDTPPVLALQIDADVLNNRGSV